MKLWENGTIYSLNNNNDIYNKIITNNGIVIAANDSCDNYTVDEVIDLEGNFMFPGFIDAHIHLIGYGRKLASNNLELKSKKEEVINLLHKFNTNSNKLLVEGYLDIGLTNKELDKIANNYPVILRHNDYHSFTVNSYVIDLLNLNSSNGILLDEEKANKVLPLWMSNTKSELYEFASNAVTSLQSLGITSVHTDDLAYFNSYNETLDILTNISNKLIFRINTLIHHDIYHEYLKGYKKDKYLNDIQIKLFYDGTLSSKTALLSSNYKNSNSNGTSNVPYHDFNKIINKINDDGYSVAIHTIGDKALEEVVDILSKYQNNSIPNRIVHASLSSIDTIKRLSNLDIALDIQPLFIKSDMKWINNVIDHDVLIYPFKIYNDYKIIINASSDSPVESPDPLLNLYYLDNIKRIDAIKAYTLNPSYTIGNKNGIIEVGKIADFTIFNKDIMNISKDELLTTKVVRTVIDEITVYKYEE